MVTEPVARASERALPEPTNAERDPSPRVPTEGDASGRSWPFTDSEHTASSWVAPLLGPQGPKPLTYNETLQLARRRGSATQQTARVATTTVGTAPVEAAADHDPRTDAAAEDEAPGEGGRALPVATVQGPVEAPHPLGDPLSETPGAHEAASTATLTEFVPAGSATVVERSVVAEPTPDRRSAVPVEPADPATAAHTAASPGRRVLSTALVLVWLVVVGLSAGRLADAHDLWHQPEVVTRIGAVVATWLAIVTLARRAGGRWILIGLFAAVVLGLVTAYPENWALAGAGVTAATVYGVLGMVLTRPATGFRTLRELLVSALVGAVGAVVVTGYDVVLRPFRFRVMVLTLVLIGGFALAWRLGQGARSLGRRGVVLIAGGVLVLALSIAYTQAIRAWGSPGVISSFTDLEDTIETRLGAVPRPIEALVGFPALVWGVAIRSRRRQGWWMCAFGSLGAAGVATSLIQPASPFTDSVAATAYDVLIGGLLGLVLVLLDRLLTGRGKRAAADATEATDRPEPARFAPLL